MRGLCTPVECPISTPKPLFEFYRCDDYLALPRNPQPWLIEKLIPKGGAINLYGKPKLGKSFAALGIAEAIANPERKEFLGHRVIEHGPVSYLQVDTPRDEWANRIENLTKHNYQLNNIYFTDANLVPYPLEITEKEIREGLRDVINQQKPLLLVVDTLRESHGQDENDSTAMRMVINSLVMATKEVSCTLLLVSHSRKSIQNAKGGRVPDDVTDDARGGYVNGRMDMIAKLTDKQLLLKGRSIADTTLHIDREKSTHMLALNGKKAESLSHLKYVMDLADVTDRGRAELLAAMEGIEVEAARSRIRNYRKQKVDTAVQTGDNDNSNEKENDHVTTGN